MIGVGENDGTLDKALAMVPDVFDKVTGFFKKDKKGNKDKTDKTPVITVDDSEAEE